MSLYSDLFGPSAGASSSDAPSTASSNNTGLGTPASASTASVSNSAATNTSTPSTSTPTLIKPAFVGAPRALQAARPIPGALTPAQRALQIQAAAQRSAAAKAAAAASASTSSPIAASSTSTASFDTPDEDADLISALQSLPNEYNPLQPNEYAEILAERTKEEREARRMDEERLEARERERQERYEREHQRELRGSDRSGGGYGDRHSSHPDLSRHRNSSSRDHSRDRSDDMSDHDYNQRASHHIPQHQQHHSHPPSSASAAPAAAASPSFSGVIAPVSSGPKLDLSVSSGDEAYQRRLAMSRNVVAPQQTSTKPLQPFVAASTNPSLPIPPPPTTAASLPSTTVDDTSKRARIEPVPSALGVPSRVVLLLNMVSRGDVDEELEGETAEECAKFGRVIKCTVFEHTAATEEDEAVRIFVKFETIEAAQKAAQELNGRYFGGRRVKAKFVEEARFNKGQLAP